MHRNCHRKSRFTHTLAPFLPDDTPNIARGEVVTLNDFCPSTLVYGTCLSTLLPTQWASILHVIFHFKLSKKTTAYCRYCESDKVLASSIQVVHLYPCTKVERSIRVSCLPATHILLGRWRCARCTRGIQIKSSPLLPHIHPSSLIMDWSVKLTCLVVTALPVIPFDL